MKVKIAVFARFEMMERIKAYTNDEDDFEIVPFTYSNAIETVELIEKAIMCDIYLFTEILPFLYVKKKIDKKRLPAVKVAVDEYMIMSSFYRLKYEHNQPLDRFSIDVLNQIHVDEVLTELNKLDKDIYTYSISENGLVDLDKIVSFHQNLWKEGKIDFVLTSSNEIEQQLKGLGITARTMHVPKINLRRAMTEAKTMTKLNQSKSAQIVIGKIRIKNLMAIKLEKGENATQELIEKLHDILLKFSQKTAASTFPINNDEFILLGTKGVLDHITNHYRDFPLLKEMERTLHTPVDIGLGLGLTAKQAENNAKMALEACEQSDNSSCYIVNERQDTIGPLGIRKQFDTSRLYQSLIHKARLNNELSYNFIDFITIRNNEPFSSNDIATYYRVTKRSAERTVNKLLLGEVIKVVGEEKPYVKGRPRKLFSLNQ
ncbi:hypothetical protein CIL05_02150 [Virgibacillus profundi]|uniref:Transcriptional regulator n=1 Tax=Virgibacillus profundi TaxID=2024555 RepID=A0A2A2IJB3_9BACI|nr:hypothetical protein [Virgibacillus profundi]PAV31478.1 hypothetical protein CIL05_02150 [Virgibacillus profundi]PXY55664.1 hypothetical protein CIT14_02160 [Virgibacillus profundi]